MASFGQAWKDGADIIELDVRLSADQEPVVIHDAWVDRTTDGTGRVSRMTLSELKRLDAGAWFEARFAGERIPTLEEVFAWARGRIGLLLELKFDPYGAFEPLLTPTVLETVSRMSILEQIAIISYQPRALVQAKALAPDILAGPIPPRDGVLKLAVWLFQRFPILGAIKPYRKILVRPLTYTRAWGGDVVGPNIDVVTPILVDAAHRGGCPISCGGLYWDYPAAIRMGVDTISANNPGLVRSLYL